jgi:hypothetical protein
MPQAPAKEINHDQDRSRTIWNPAKGLLRSILLVEETGVSEKTTDLQEATNKLYRIMLYSSPRAGIEPTTSVVIDTDRIDSCKSNYNTITATTAPNNLLQFEWLIVVLRIVINFLTISRTSYISMRWWWSPRCINPTLVVRMYSTSSRNCSAWSDIWLQSVILCWFRANKSVYLLLHAACSVDKQ